MHKKNQQEQEIPNWECMLKPKLYIQNQKTPFFAQHKLIKIKTFERKNKKINLNKKKKIKK